jgi:hypothetical protein
MVCRLVVADTGHALRRDPRSVAIATGLTLTWLVSGFAAAS